MSPDETYAIWRTVLVRIKAAEDQSEGVLLDSIETCVLADGLRTMSARVLDVPQ